MIQKIIIIIYNFIDKHYHMKRIVSLINNNDIKVVFDVGAHEGEFSQSIANQCNKLEKIYVFEPQKIIYRKLQQNLMSFNNIHIFNYALSKNNHDKILKINAMSTTSTFSEINYNSLWFKIKNFILMKKDSFVDTEIVKVNTIDNFVKSQKIKNIDLLKIDTEGHETDVLLGASLSFKKKMVKNILIEIEPKAVMYNNYNPEEIHKSLLSNGFTLIKTFSFPFHRVEDRFYSLTK
jgi:FkbM family methyltransferase